MEHEQILTVIKKCLALSQSSNEHEAAAAAAKAQELLFKYNLSMAEVETVADSSEEKTKVTKNTIELRTAKNQGRWKVILVDRVARYNFCDVILWGKDRIVIIGQPHNIAVVHELYSWTAEQIQKFAAEACKDYIGYDRIPTFRRSFLESAAHTVANRLYRQWIASQKQSEMSTALVVNHEVMVRNYVEQQFPDLKAGRNHQGSSSSDGHRAGREAGDRVSLTASKKLGSSNQRSLS